MISVLNRLHLPTFQQMVEDLGSPSASVVARALGVHKRTVERWSRRGYAPRHVMLGLFWLTRWGRSELNCKLERDAATWAGYSSALKTENEALRRELARLLSAGDFGCANAPSWRETTSELIQRRRVPRATRS